MNKFIILVTISAVVHGQSCIPNDAFYEILIEQQYDDKIEDSNNTAICEAIHLFTNASAKLTNYVGRIVMNQTIELETNVRLYLSLYIKFMCILIVCPQYTLQVSNFTVDKIKGIMRSFKMVNQTITKLQQSLFTTMMLVSQLVLIILVS